MSIKKLAMLAPELCGADDFSREGEIACLVFDANKNNPNSSFKRNQGDKIDPAKRIKMVMRWKPAVGMEGKKQFIEDIFVFANDSHYAIEHKDKEAIEGLEEIKQDLIIREKLYPDVKAIQPVAEIMGTWV